MYKREYGDPVLTLRIPQWQYTALKMLSKQSGVSVSALIREQIDSILWVNGITKPEPEQLPGQIHTSDLGNA